MNGICCIVGAGDMSGTKLVIPEGAYIIAADAGLEHLTNAGLTPELIETIAAMSPDRVVYVSCDPATLSRDLKQFAGTAVIENASRTYQIEYQIRDGRFEITSFKEKSLTEEGNKKQ